MICKLYRLFLYNFSSKLTSSWLPKFDDVEDSEDKRNGKETATRSIVGPETSPREEVSRKLQLLRQTLTSLGPIMATIAMGATFGYSAILLPQIKSLNLNESFSVEGEDDFLDVKYGMVRVNNLEEESWVAASATLLMAPGCWMSGILMERLGRRKSQLLIGPTYLSAWVMVGFAPNLGILIAGRVLSGLCSGLQGPLGPVYVSETSEPRLRGLLLSGISLAIAVGILISHVLGTWLSWRVAAHILSTFPILCLFFCLLAPESPVWLIRKNRLTEAEKAWKYLRGNNADEEFNSLIKSTDNFLKEEKSNDSSSSGWKSRAFLKPLAILNVFFFVAQFSGVNAVAFYCIEIAGQVSGPDNAHYATLILDFARVAASILACWLTRSLPRRYLALISGVGTSLSLLGLSGGLVFDLGTPWLPGIFFLTYISAVSIGIVPIPWFLCGEIFPVATRGLGSGLSSGFAFLCFFIVVKTGPAMLNGIGTPATFLFYGIIATLGTVFIYFFLPETKDKTLQEIEKHFAHTKSIPP